MIEAALWIAIAAAVCGALARNRVAWVLLPSVAYCLYLDWAGAAFNPLRWLVLDVSAMALIAWVTLSNMTYANCAIFGLFFVGWTAYMLPDPYRYIGSTAVTILQLLLTFPLGKSGQMMRRLFSRWKANFRFRDEWTNLESREAHG